MIFEIIGIFPQILVRQHGAEIIRMEERSVAFMAHGDYGALPFLRREEFQEALKKPALLKANI